VPVASVTGSIVTAIGDWGLYAVFLLMVLDAVFPAASELVMLYAGVLAAGAIQGHHVTLFGAKLTTPVSAFFAIAITGAIGNTIGSLAGWAIGAYGGRPFLEQRGRLLHVSPAKLGRAERWFERYGNAAVFIGRVTPVLRSFISYPAGIVRLPLARFTLLTFAGCLVWCFAFAGAGWGVGTGWRSVHDGFRYVDYSVVAIVVLAAAYFVFRFIRTQYSRA
jgi:membrane protein DedA with SNARE-associated domain